MNKRAIIKISGLALLLIFMAVTMVFIALERKKIETVAVQVVFNENHRFVNENEIDKLIKQQFGELTGTLTDTINTFSIKQIIEKHPWVEKASVFKGYARHDSLFYAGSIKVIIKQETPVVRVIQPNESFYVTAKGHKAPLSDTHTLSVPVVTGSVSDSLLQNHLLPFISYISSDIFLSALVVQIHVKANSELVLVPRVGNHNIEFGKIENIESKFRNLRAVYEKGFGNDEWEKYRTVSLKYKNQVICSI